MDKKLISQIDGSISEQVEALKVYFELEPEQSFNDLDIGIEEDEE